MVNPSIYRNIPVTFDLTRWLGKEPKNLELVSPKVTGTKGEVSIALKKIKTCTGRQPSLLLGRVQGDSKSSLGGISYLHI